MTLLPPLAIDGSMGEGGGQILRSSLALSMVTGRPIHIRNIRARRKKPGMMRQHLTAVQSAARISSAHTIGAELHSRELVFEPNAVAPGTYHISIGTAGSTTLVLQTLLPALVCAAGESTVVLEGGTHNPLAPPYEFLSRVYLPALERMGAKVECRAEAYGFAPAGAGKLRAEIAPAARLEAIQLTERGRVLKRRAIAMVANLPRHIADRELAVVAEELGWKGAELVVSEVEARGQGNLLLLEIESEHVSEIFVGFGERGVRAETVAGRAIEEARRYLEADVAVGEHLADQLLLPMALAGGGRMTTTRPSLHATTQMDLIPKFLEVRFSAVETSNGRWTIEVVTNRPA